MSGFLRHDACDKCKSSDALAVYEDGSQHCFSCGYHRSANGYDKIKAIGNPKNKIGIIYNEKRAIGPEGLQWLSKYKLTDTEREIFTWDEEKKHLIYREGNFTNARTFIDGDKKYMSYGEKPYSILGTGAGLVLVEDIISAIKVSRVTRAMCLFGSSAPLSCLPVGVHISIWLDPDKIADSIMIGHRLRDLGIKAETIFAEKDPKDYSTEYICTILKNHLHEIPALCL